MPNLILHNNHTVSFDYGVQQGTWKRLTWAQAKGFARYKFTCWCGDSLYADLQWRFRADIEAHLSKHLGPIVH